MANMLQSSQNKTTCVPSFYTNYLTNLANKTTSALCQAKYVGAQPLQEEAFCKVKTNFGASQPAFQQGQKLLGCAANVNISGAATPYLKEAQSINTGQLAQCYMSPYINNAVQNMSNIAMRNIHQNLIPQANAAAISSGQFGSQRGAQVQGQVEANAMQDLNSQIANMENAGYANALNAAVQKQSLLGQLGSTAATASAECARAKQAAGTAMGQLGTQQSTANLACINALATLGEQQQKIGQNAQCYNLSKLTKGAQILQGAQIPTSVKTTMCMSPLSAAGAVGSGIMGVLCKYPNIYCSIKSGVKDLLKLPSGSSGTGAGDSGYHDPVYEEKMDTSGGYHDPVYDESGNQGDALTTYDFARGGLISPRGIGAIGCSSTRYRGGLPRG